MFLSFVLDSIEKSSISDSFISSTNKLIDRIVDKLNDYDVEAYKSHGNQLTLKGQKIKIVYRILSDHDHLIRSFYSPLISEGLTEELIRHFSNEEPKIVVAILLFDRMEPTLFDKLIRNYEDYCKKFANIPCLEFQSMVRDAFFNPYASIGLIAISNYKTPENLLKRPSMVEILKDLEQARREEIREKKEMGKNAKKRGTSNKGKEVSQKNSPR